MSDQKKVLVVDDDPDILETVRFCMEEAGYDVVESADGLDALQKVETESPDLIVLDVMLPGKSGFMVCWSLKNNEKFRDIPVIMLTAKSQPIDKVLGRQTQANEYLTKPFDIDELVDLVGKHI